MTDAEDWDIEDERARKFADRQWKRAMENREDIDPWIEKSRKREVEAAIRGRPATARWWSVIGDTLAVRQKLNDEAKCYGIYDIEWPDGLRWDFEQAFEQNDSIEGPEELGDDGQDFF